MLGSLMMLEMMLEMMLDVAWVPSVPRSLGSVLSFLDAVMLKPCTCGGKGSTQFQAKGESLLFTSKLS